MTHHKYLHVKAVWARKHTMSHKVVCNASLINESAVERWGRWQNGAVHAYSVPESSDQLQEHPGSEQQDIPYEEGSFSVFRLLKKEVPVAP